MQFKQIFILNLYPSRDFSSSISIFKFSYLLFAVKNNNLMKSFMFGGNFGFKKKFNPH